MYETRNDLAESTKGPNFVGLHDLFDRVADAAREYVDLLAERGVALGGVAEGTVQSVSRKTKLAEYAANSGDWTAHVEAIRTALAAFGSSARRAIDQASDLEDADTADLLTEVARDRQVELDGRSPRSEVNRAIGSGGIPVTSDRHETNREAQRCPSGRRRNRLKVKQRSRDDYSSASDRR